MIIVSGIRISLAEGEKAAPAKAVRALGLAKEDVLYAGVYRTSYDARHGEVSLVCSAALKLSSSELESRIAAKEKNVRIKPDGELHPKFGSKELNGRPVIAGFGPAGIFAAYVLAIYGYRPIVIERGAALAQRIEAVERFSSGGEFDPDSNIQFGEGGAGTFSDGKLTTRINDPLCEYILRCLCAFGAPREVLRQAKPHIGTDFLRRVVSNANREICAAGGEIRFLEPLKGLRIRNGRVCGVVTPSGEISCGVLVTACGHSARELFGLLADCGAQVVPKPFSIGLRIEHLRQDIDRAMWGVHAGDPRLPAAEYAINTKIGGRGVYSFCMCPGGSVVAAASEEGGVVTNGMSCHARNGRNSNAALCVSVYPEDFGKGTLDGVRFQRKLEQAAFCAGGGDYLAPACSVGGFLQGKPNLNPGRVEPTYPRGINEADLGALLGPVFSEALRGGIAEFGKKIQGFDAADALLTALETRTSSPVIVKRRESGEAIGIDALYPCGEGAGYAGGIMSAAVDGVKTALKIIETYRPIKR